MSDRESDLAMDSESEDDLDYYYDDPMEEVIDDSESTHASVAVNNNNNNDVQKCFDFECLSRAETRSLLQCSVDALVASVEERVGPEAARAALVEHAWDAGEARRALLTRNRGPKRVVLSSVRTRRMAQEQRVCNICLLEYDDSCFHRLDECGHSFCHVCWDAHFATLIAFGSAHSLSCMSSDCDVLAPESFVLGRLSDPALRARFKSQSLASLVRSHPRLRLCPGDECDVVVRAIDKPSAKRCVCHKCHTVFCFMCSGPYHAPTDCETIRKWLTKCADDSETANYISAHTKDCPKCNICIEKNGGCNHMRCYSCKHDFCWMCRGDWKTHGSEYYECSRYKERPSMETESAHAVAREALKKYLHYFERWENHSKSLKLEAEMLEKIRKRITLKVMSCQGTWIDWQYLIDAAALLAKCRYTLQYTYPFAYYMKPCPRKDLFEYQQAQLEAEIENLSWKIEHAETTDRGDLERQIDVAEKRRTSLLKDFVENDLS